MRNSQNLTVILPAKGRLKEDFSAILARAGLQAGRISERLDSGMLTDRRGEIPALETIFERADDALQTLADGAADLAVVGRDTLLEFNRAARAKNPRFPENNLNLLLALPEVSACKICIAGPESRAFDKESDLQGMRFATPFPAILKHWLNARNITPVGILVRSGGSEATVAQGRADVVCDLVRTGETLAANGLESKFIVENEISAVVVGRVGLWNAEKSAIARALLRRLETAAQPAMERARQPVPARMEIF